MSFDVHQALLILQRFNGSCAVMQMIGFVFCDNIREAS